MLETIIDRAKEETDPSVSGAVYYASLYGLFHNWKHGEQLKTWHIKQTQDKYPKFYFLRIKNEKTWSPWTFVQRFEIDPNRDDGPCFYSMCGDMPIAYLKDLNEETCEIRSAKVKFPKN